MDDGNKHPSKRRKDLKAATHILKREALRRYREKLHRRLAEEEKSAKLASLNAGHSTDDDRLNNTLSNTKVGSDILPIDMEEDKQIADSELADAASAEVAETVADQQPDEEQVVPGTSEDVEAVEPSIPDAVQSESGMPGVGDTDTGLADTSVHETEVPETGENEIISTESGENKAESPKIGEDEPVFPETDQEKIELSETEGNESAENGEAGSELPTAGGDETEAQETGRGGTETPETGGVKTEVPETGGDEDGQEETGGDKAGREETVVDEVQPEVSESTDVAKAEIADGEKADEVADSEQTDAPAEGEENLSEVQFKSEESLEKTEQASDESVVTKDDDDQEKSAEDKDEKKDSQASVETEPTDLSRTEEEKKLDSETQETVEDEEIKQSSSTTEEEVAPASEDAKEESLPDGSKEETKDEKDLSPTQEKIEETSVPEPESEEEQIVYETEDYQSTPRVSDDSGIPLDILSFYHSFGYDCRKRSNLYLLQGPTALFAAGNCIHLLNLGTDEHRFLRTYSGGGVGALTVHPTGNYFAVAEKGEKPNIMIYHFPSLSLHRILRGGTEKAYSFVDFNPKGNLLASVGSAPDYMLTVWDWNKENIMLRSKAFSQEVYRVTFSPEQEGQLTSCGTTHIRFWKMALTFTGLKLKGELGRFGKTALGDIDGYIQLPDGKVLSGSDWGNMLLWDGGLIKVEISRKSRKPCHVGSIQQLVMDEGELITIGKDGCVRVWEMEAIDSADVTDDSDIFEVEPMNELRVGHDVELMCMVKAPPEDEKEGDESSSIWYAQDANGGIWKLDLSFSHTTKPPEKLYSYTAGPITGVACSPVSHLMATTGDAFVRIYDYLSKKLVCQYFTPTPQSHGTCLVWPNQVIDPKGTTIVAGFSDGIVRILTLQQVETENEIILKEALKPHSAAVTAMAYDNTGQTLATGSTDHTVFFFSVDSDGYIPIGFVKVPGEVTGLQWSPAGFSKNSVLVSTKNGKVVEIVAPDLSDYDTSHSFHLHDVTMRFYTFKSVKSELRRDEEKERKAEEKAVRRKSREKELKRRREAGEEISAEDAQAFLDDDPEAEEEKEEEPLYYPPEPNPVLQAFYIKPGRFAVSMGGYDAGYFYECRFPEKARTDDPDIPTKPVRSVPVKGSNDEPITRTIFTADRHKFIAGCQNGILRVYPLESDPEEQFDFDMLGSYWEFNMHDNDTGPVINLAESHDGAHLFSGGADGNLFGYLSLAHDEIIKSIEGKRAKLPTPKKASSRQLAVEDIDDPQAYSIEDAKLKAEHDKMVREAEAKKALERKKIHQLRKTFLDLRHKNNDLPDSVKLLKEDFELDPSLRQNMLKETRERIERVRLEMQWDKAKLALIHEKLKNRFRSRLECDRIVLHSFQTSHTVASYRLDELSEEFHKLRSALGETIRTNSISSDTGTVGVPDRSALMSDRTKDETSSIEDEEPYLRDQQVQKQKATILHGRQAEKVQKALQKAAEAKERREKRQQEWEELYKNKPDENYEDPADVAAIKDAQSHMGDFKLKTAPDYVVPEHLRMDTEKKRFQILTLQEIRYKSRTQFNEKLLKLRDEKFAIIDEIKGYVDELKKLQKTMAESDRAMIPPVPIPHPEEQPHKKFEYTKESLLQFEEDEKKRAVEAAKKKRKGDGGLFGGFGGEESGAGHSVHDAKMSQHRKTPSSAASSISRARSKVVEPERVPPSSLETQIAQIEMIRARYNRDRLLRLINEKITLFDSELRLLRQSKTKLDVNLKMADLREVTLIEELLLLKEYEKREKTLSGRVAGKKNELTDILGKAAEMQVKFEAKRRDIERLSDREKALYASFTMSLGENNKFAEFLNKVFKKKIKRAKKKVAAEGEEEDSDVTSSDESDWSSDEDDDESMEGVFDDSMCPPGCDQQLFDSAIALREKRLDLEEALVEEKKTAETLKKDTDTFSKKAKVMESQLKTALADLEAFQVEKQGKLNELDVVVLLRLHQVEHVYNGVVPNDLSPCLVFTNSSLTALQRRIKELQQEKNEQRKFYKEARQQHVHLIKSRKIMEQRINLWEEKCENMMMLKFGRVVDLERIDSVTINKTVEELKEKVRLNELRNSQQLAKKQRHIERLKERMTELIRENTKRLETLNVFITDKEALEQTLDKRQKNLELDDPNKAKQEMREQHRLVQLVQLQAQEIQALKEEIGLLSRKGGHILPPAQPPLGQENEVM